MSLIGYEIFNIQLRDINASTFTVAAEMNRRIDDRAFGHIAIGDRDGPQREVGAS